jgi:hypothetical protein
MGTVKPFTLGVAVAACVPSPVAAQAVKDQKEAQVWSIPELRTGYCVRFAIEPRAASRELKKAFRLVPASEDRNLNPALQQMIQHQPEFASWSPSDLCFYFGDAVQMGTRRVAEKNARNQQMLAVWTIAAQDEKSRRRQDLVLGIFSARSSLRRAAEAAGVRLHEADVAVVDSADSANDIYTIKLERTSLIWRGRPTGDSTRMDRVLQESWQVPGMRSGVWSVEFKYQPQWSRALVGSLTVEGKGDLAKALKASPIRFVGPLYQGGRAELRFNR